MQLSFFVTASVLLAMAIGSKGSPSSSGSRLKDPKGIITISNCVSEARIREIVKEMLLGVVAAVPNGFIYVQFPRQASPESLWPSSSWKEVTEDYAGHFFRAAGGGAEVFETAQAENCPRVARVNARTETSTTTSQLDFVFLEPGTTSRRLWTGDDVPESQGPHNLRSTSFTTTGGEVRPKNYAVKIWIKVE